MFILRRILLTLALAASAAASHAQVGLQRLSWPGAGGDDASQEVHAAAWYPTPARAQPMRFGPLAMEVAPGAPVPTSRLPLVVLSHGAGGSEWAQAWLAQGLAARGYVVVALRHPHDNQDDRTLQSSAGYFVERARQVSRLLDTLSADPTWGPVIDANRIAVVGHSAGGGTALLLAGARIDPARLMAHCGPDGPGRQSDAAFCAMGRSRGDSPRGSATTARDARVKVAVAAVPVAAMFDPASLAGLEVPLLVENSGADQVLAPRHHGAAVCAAMPTARCTLTPGAGHRAFAQAGLGPDDPPADFDRGAYQRDALARIATFLDDALPAQNAPR